ncbi:MAG TPA: beta-ketoacyl-ACP synthase II [Acidobacteriota bacterium]|nr:beta-ketoacyl-ACP synthase II [Acidobacteriota bacterium]HQM64233.1 beta-ketoacyl-ACP synthase II [Acidobacteriota bacterium]
MNTRRVVVTGVGMVSATGTGTDKAWQNIVAGVSGVGPITLFDAAEFSVRIAAEVRDFNPEDFMDKKEVRKYDRFIHFALAASEFAVKGSGLPLEATDLNRAGVYIGSGIGGFATIEAEHEKLLKGGPRKISPYFIPATIINLASGMVSIKFGLKGPNCACCTACATSSHALGDSFRIIQRGDADVMIAGGSEAAITPMGVGGFAAMRAISARNDNPTAASRPFDKERDGFVVGEGAGVLVLEELDHARRRGAPIVAEIVGYGMTGDAFHITAPPPDGDGACRAMLAAVHDAGIRPEDVDYINAHGTSTPFNDKLETIAIKRAFGDHATRLRISSTKSMTGHLLGAAGGLEGAITALALRDQVIPPTINYEFPDPECDLNYTPNVAARVPLRYALSNSFGFGGTNAVLLFKRYEA